MEYTIGAAARNLGNVLARRYRRDAFVIERNGTRIARVVPVSAPAAGTVGEVLAVAVRGRRGPRLCDLAALNASDRTAFRS